MRGREQQSLGVDGCLGVRCSAMCNHSYRTDWLVGRVCVCVCVCVCVRAERENRREWVCDQRWKRVTAGCHVVGCLTY